MIKVGILSMQRIFNYGSFLQAYGLKKILEELGCEVEFVDYHPGPTLIPADGGTGIKRKIAKVLEVFKYHASFKDKIRFVKYKKNFAANYFSYLGIDSKMNYRPELDILVIGSDEVFNCVQNNTNVGFSPELFGADNNAKRVITYAASFGNTTVEKLENYNVDKKVSVWLKDINAISVRDQNSGEIIKQLVGEEPVYNFDPVLVYDFIGECSGISVSVSKDKYMIFYGYAGRFSKDECRKIRNYADSKGLKIFCIGGVQDECDKFIDCNPLQVIAYFQYAECIVTDTFHGTIMSIITHRPFVSVIRNIGYGNSEKLTDLLDRLKLNNRIIYSMDDLKHIMKNVVSYEETDEIIREERKKAYDYLANEINLYKLKNRGCNSESRAKEKNE